MSMREKAAADDGPAARRLASPRPSVAVDAEPDARRRLSPRPSVTVYAKPAARRHASPRPEGERHRRCRGEAARKPTGKRRCS
jgi:hypothetical protein